MITVSKHIWDTDVELAKFLVEEFKKIPDYREISLDYIPSEEELKDFTDEELTDLIMDAGLEADMSYDTPEFETLQNRYEMIKCAVTKEREIRKNEI